MKAKQTPLLLLQRQEMKSDKKDTKRLVSDSKKTDAPGEQPEIFNKVEIDGGDSSLFNRLNTERKHSQDGEEKKPLAIEATSREMHQCEVKHTTRQRSATQCSTKQTSADGGRETL